MSREGRKANKGTLMGGGQLGLNLAGAPLRNPEGHTLELSHPPSKEAGEFVYHLPSLTG